MRSHLLLAAASGALLVTACADPSPSVLEPVGTAPDSLAFEVDRVATAGDYQTVFEATSSAGLTLRVLASAESIRSVTDIFTAVDAEPAEVDFSGLAELVEGGSWSLGPADAALSDRWRFEFQWDEDRFDGVDLSALSVAFDDQTEGEWLSLPVVSRSAVDRTLTVESGRLGTIALLIPSTPDLLVPADQASTWRPVRMTDDIGAAGISVTPTPLADKVETSVLIRHVFGMAAGSFPCFQLEGGPMVPMTFASTGYRITVVLDLPGTFNFRMLVDDDANCGSPDAGSLYPSTKTPIVVPNRTLSQNNGCVDVAGDTYIRAFIDGTTSSSSAGDFNCPNSSGNFIYRIRHLLRDVSPSVPVSNTVCLDLGDGPQVASPQGGARARFFFDENVEFDLFPRDIVFNWWESKQGDCSDVLREFFPVNSSLTYDDVVFFVAGDSCIERPGGSPGQVSASVTYNGFNTGTNTGTLQCTPMVCGDGILHPAEGCDDGNNEDGDGCDALCNVEICGNGVVQGHLGEECDDGNTVSFDGCSSTCQEEVCGDFIQHADEQCDDGPTGSATCDSECNLIVCGNGIVQDGEECDPPGPECSASCQTIDPEDACTDQDLGVSVTAQTGIDLATQTNDSSSACGGATGEDRTFLWKAPHSGLWSFFAIGQGGFLPILYLRPVADDVCGSELSCSGPASPAAQFLSMAIGDEIAITLDGNAPVGVVDLVFSSPPVPLTETVDAPAPGDPTSIASGSNFWSEGDSVTMEWQTSYASLAGLNVSLATANNFLTATRCRNPTPPPIIGDPHQYVDVIVNGNTIGQLAIGPGDTVVEEDFIIDPPIAGPDYTIVYETAATVNPGCGSSGYDVNNSTIELIPAIP